MSTIINRRAMGMLATRVRWVACFQADVNRKLWLFAMMAAKAPHWEVIAAIAASETIIGQFYTMRPERLIAEYGHLLPRTP